MKKIQTKSVLKGFTRRTFLAVIAAASISGFSALDARADDKADAQVFLKDLTDKAISRLTDESIPAQQREDNFRNLFRENFDIDAIGRFVVGRYWRSADKQAQEDFLATFENVMVQRFAPQFSGYGDTRFEIKGVRPLKSKGQFLVTSSIALPGKEPAQVDWRVRRKGGSWRVLDVIGEGVSMAQTLRSEYGAVLKDVGGDLAALTAKLQSSLPS
jgi:phospholipid transport system substrate-binding protein